MSGAFIIVTVFLCLAARKSLQSGVVALSLTYALQLTGQVIHGCLKFWESMAYPRLFTVPVVCATECRGRISHGIELILTFTLTICLIIASIIIQVSVERTLEYSYLEPEQPEQTNDHPSHGKKHSKYAVADIALVPRLTAPPPSWPTEGAFEFRDVCMRYNDDSPLVLKNVSFVVQPREKVVFAFIPHDCLPFGRENIQCHSVIISICHALDWCCRPHRGREILLALLPLPPVKVRWRRDLHWWRANIDPGPANSPV